MSDPPLWPNRKGHGRSRKRKQGGRPRASPHVSFNWNQVEGDTDLILSSQELEALRLVDGEGLTQKEAAIKMQISRGTVWRLIDHARKEIAKALGSGHKIKVWIDQSGKHK